MHPGTVARWGLLALLGGAIATAPSAARAAGSDHGRAAVVAAGKHVDNPVFTPIKPLLARVTIPLRLPSTFPNGKQRIYADVDKDSTTPYSYLIYIGYAKGCDGSTVCALAEATGGPVVDTPTIFDYPRARHVTMRGGVKALYFPYTCGASCGSSTVVWQEEGVVYTISLKAGSQKDTLTLANSALPG